MLFVSLILLANTISFFFCVSSNYTRELQRRETNGILSWV